MPRYNDAALKESLRAKIEEDSAVQQLRETEALNRATSSTNARIIALTVMLMILAFFAIFATDVASEPSNKVLRNQAAHLFRPTIELALLGLVFVWVLSSKRVLKWASVLELSNVHRRATMWAFLTISIALMVLLLTLTHSKLENVITGIIGVTQGATK